MDTQSNLNYLDTVLAMQKRGETVGIPSICSAHPFVLNASFRHAKLFNIPVLVEATCNQVNQFGGYTGMTPLDYVAFVHVIAKKNEFPLGCLILGGDHLGPNVWQNEPALIAMQKSAEMVRGFVQAGFTKIHLDTSMRLADDPPGRLAPEIAAQRAALLAKVTESYAPDIRGLRYVIGTEVPVPGGAIQGHTEQSVQITKPEDVQLTIQLTREAFLREG